MASPCRTPVSTRSVASGRLSGKDRWCSVPVAGRKIARRILGIDACLEGVAGQRDLFLRERQRLARGDSQLPFDKIGAGHHLGDGMLHLQAACSSP